MPGETSGPSPEEMGLKPGEMGLKPPEKLKIPEKMLLNTAEREGIQKLQEQVNELKGNKGVQEFLALRFFMNRQSIRGCKR